VVEPERNHRDRSKKIVRVPAGTPDRNSQQDQSRSGALSGRVMLSCRFRRLRFAPAPANIPRASGALGVCQLYQDSPLCVVWKPKRRGLAALHTLRRSCTRNWKPLYMIWRQPLGRRRF